MEISSNKHDFFLKNGFVHFENALSITLLKKLQRFSDKLEALALENFHNGQVNNQCCISTDSGLPRLFRYNDLLFESPELIIELLASPPLIEVYKELVGNGAVPLQLDVAYKYPYPHPHITWHQDAPHSRQYPYLNIGIYLDDALLEDGCLRYVPNTQHKILDIYALSNQYGWDIPNVVQQPAKAGDIIVHDIMILHSSGVKRSQGARRTLYVELRPILGITESGKQTKEWAELRKQWMAHVIKAADPNSIPQAWHEFYGEPKYDLSTLVKLIKAKPEAPIPSIHDHKNVVHPNYPTPKDLR